MDPQPALARQQVGGERAGRQLDADDRAEAGVADPLDRGVLAQAAGQLGGVGLGALDAQVQGAHAADREPGLEGAGDGPQQVAALLEHGEQLVVAGDQRAQQRVGVTCEVLGRGVDDQVRAEVERTLQQRGGEGVVDDDVRPRLVGRGADPLDVGDVEVGVGGRLDPHQRDVLVTGRDDRVGVGDVDQLRAQPSAHVEIGDLRQAALVGGVRREHQRALPHEVQHDGDRGQAGGERQRPAALELAEHLLEGLPGGVAVAAVLPVAAGHVGRGHRDRGVQRLVHLVRRAPRGHRDRGRAQVGRGGVGQGVVGHGHTLGSAG